MTYSERTLGEIETTQAKLRESIETAKDLAEKSEKLIRKHRREIEAEAHSQPAG